MGWCQTVGLPWGCCIAWISKNSPKGHPGGAARCMGEQSYRGWHYGCRLPRGVRGGWMLHTAITHHRAHTGAPPLALPTTASALHHGTHSQPSALALKGPHTHSPPPKPTSRFIHQSSQAQALPTPLSRSETAQAMQSPSLRPRGAANLTPTSTPGVLSHLHQRRRRWTT